MRRPGGCAGQDVRRRPVAVRVLQFGLNLGNRPVTRTAPIADPAEQAPAGRHLGQRDRDFQLGTFGARVAGASPVRAADMLAGQLIRPYRVWMRRRRWRTHASFGRTPSRRGRARLDSTPRNPCPWDSGRASWRPPFGASPSLDQATGTESPCGNLVLLAILLLVFN